MLIDEGCPDTDSALIGLFAATFAASEGPDEGAAIGDLVAALLQTPSEDLWRFTSRDETGLTGGILFSRMRYDDDRRMIVLLSPVAVRTDRQRQGVGQALINYGLTKMLGYGAAVALTYGDPAYYGQVGFVQIGPEVVQPPFPLSQPAGWLGQDLSGGVLAPVAGVGRPVAAFAKAEYW